MRAGLLPAFAALALAGCQQTFEIEQSECNECPAIEGLARPPCREFRWSGTPLPEPDGGYVYAWRNLTLGSRPLPDGGYHAGLDQDCSLREKGTPTACTPLEVPPQDGGYLVPVPPWVALPHGIDNALGTRVIGPLERAAQGIDIDGLVSQALESGQAGQLVVVRGWNGLPDDDQVLVSFEGTDGTLLPDGGPNPVPPKWDGQDVWVPHGTPDSYPQYEGYVVGGTLVVDTRSAVQEGLSIALTDANGNRREFNFFARLISRVGTITPDSLELISYGRWDVADALDQVPLISDFLGTVSSGAGQIVQSELPHLLIGAADLPIDFSPNPNPDGPCTAISVALDAQAYRVIQVAPNP